MFREYACQSGAERNERSHAGCLKWKCPWLVLDLAFFSPSLSTRFSISLSLFPPSFVISLPLSLHPCPFPAMHREFILSLILSRLEKSNRQHDSDLRFDELLDKFSSYTRQSRSQTISNQLNSKWNKFSKLRYPSISLWYIFYFLLNTIWNYLKTVPPSDLKNIYY